VLARLKAVVELWRLNAVIERARLCAVVELARLGAVIVLLNGGFYGQLRLNNRNIRLWLFFSAAHINATTMADSVENAHLELQTITLDLGTKHTTVH
jgi:hypothetical protein